MEEDLNLDKDKYQTAGESVRSYYVVLWITRNFVVCNSIPTLSPVTLSHFQLYR